MASEEYNTLAILSECVYVLCACMCVCVCVNESVYVCACVGEKVQLQRMGNGTILCIINQRVYVLQTAEPMLDYILWSSPTSSDLCDRDVKLSSMDLGTSTAIEACT